jgi:hypothetical protein
MCRVSMASLENLGLDRMISAQEILEKQEIMVLFQW